MSEGATMAGTCRWCPAQATKVVVLVSPAGDDRSRTELCDRDADAFVSQLIPAYAEGEPAYRVDPVAP